MDQLFLKPADTTLMIIDVQERLCIAMDQDWLKRVCKNIGLMTLFAGLENMPVLLTEQYPQGLGGTHSDIQQHLKTVPHQTLAKTSFSCGGDPAIIQSLAASGRKKIIITGMETHICVYLTVLDLCARGYQVFVCRDATIARSTLHHENGFELMRQAGAIITNVETLVFQMMGCSGGPTFKAISNYLKQK